MGANSGTAFERQLVQIFDGYAKQRRAKIHKVDPPHKVVTRRIAGRWVQQVILEENPWLDFAGSWAEAGGRMLVIEAKTTREPRLPLRVAKGASGLSDEQWRNGIDWQRAGAMVLILWEHRGEIRATTPAMAAHAARELGRKSIRWCDAHPLPRGLGWVRFDVLSWALQICKNAKGPE